MKKYMFPIIVLFVLSACSPKTQFTQLIKEENSLSEKELTQIQFYTTGNIVLHRAEKDNAEKEISEGELILKTGNTVEQVVFKTGTPGVVIKVLGKNKIAVRFEPGEGKYLVFGNLSSRKGIYTIVPNAVENGKKYVNYGNKRYLLGGASEYVSLVFKKKNLTNFKKDERVVKGMKL